VKLAGSASATGQLFGWSVAVGLGKIVVGAPYYKAGKNMDEGTAYVFSRTKAGWSGSAGGGLAASHGAAFDELGISVGVSGPLELAGALHDGYGLSLPPGGAAYVYARNICRGILGPGGLQPRCLPTASHELTESPYGLLGLVAVSGNTIIAGGLSRQIYVYVLRPPAITIKAPRKSYKLGTTVKASYHCRAVAPARIATCTGPVPSGAPVDTSTVGKHL
jgi:hypothetical protein